MNNGADIFLRSKEGKTSLHLANNNLLMTKIIKKAERKQFIAK